jgi:predicted glycosyltransferase involved in capsule biosynthesis
VSYWREDILAVNGYNEDFEGWGREDSDVVIRMGNNGIKAKRLRKSGIVYHIHHKINSKDNFEVNDLKQKETISNRSTWITNGIDLHR